MTKHLLLKAFAPLFVVSILAAASLPCMAQDKKSLYERVGGYNALAAVVDDFIGRLVADQRFTKFFSGHSTDSRKRIRQHSGPVLRSDWRALHLHWTQHEDYAQWPENF